MKQVVFLLSIYGSVTFRILAGYTKWHEGTNEGKKLSYSKNTTIGHLKVQHSAYIELVLSQSIAQYQYQETSENVNQVCSGQVSRLPKQNIGLTCSLLHRQLPYLALGPFQLETLRCSLCGTCSQFSNSRRNILVQRLYQRKDGSFKNHRCWKGLVGPPGVRGQNQQDEVPY